MRRKLSKLEVGKTQMSYSAKTDQELIALLKQGEQSAFAEIYNRYKNPLYFHARRMLGDNDEAKDIVQDLFAAIWSKRESLILPASVESYLYGSIRNRILDFLAHQKVITKYTESFNLYLENGAASTDELIRERELTRIIQQEISRLPEGMRKVFELSRNSDLSYKEIAAQLNIAEDSVKKQAQRAIKILRLKIKFYLFFTFFIW